jgi:hypothetical protein
MKNWLAFGLAAAVAAGALAQVTPAYRAKEGPADVKAITEAGSGSSASTQKTAAQQAANVKASKQTAKMTTAEKNTAIKDVNKQMVNPDNPSGGVAGTAAQQKANVAASKDQPKQKVKINTLGPSGKAMENAATK